MNAKNLLLLLAVVAAAFGVLSQQNAGSDSGIAASARTPSAATQSVRENDSDVDRAFAAHARNVQVEGSAVVVKVLRDDDQGSRHQKFLLRMPSGLVILVAHNIDLAPRLEGLRAGDSVAFSGEYEWSEKGGVVHWTHHDPSGRHAAGWLKHDGQTVH